MTDRQVLADIVEMARRLPQAGINDLGMWQELCAKHVELIRRYGFASFKRTVNFEYSQWGVASFRDPKMLALARKIVRHPSMLGALLRLRMRERPGGAGTWPIGEVRRHNLIAYRTYLALLYGYARSEDRLGCLELEEPSLGRPLDTRIKGRRISQDLCLSSLELNAIALHCDLRSLRSVAEVGAGYGRLAWVVAAFAPGARYHVYDIPPALAIAQNYLRAVLGPDRVFPFRAADTKQETRDAQIVMHMPDELERAPDAGFDLFINVSAFDEMPRAQVEKYFDLIDRKTRGLLYLKGYVKNRRTGWDVRDFPYRAHWRRLWHRTDPTNPAFIEQIFRTP